MNKSECVHIWVIDPPEGPTSIGICRQCSEKRDFLNSLSEETWSADARARAAQRGAAARSVPA